MARLDPQSLEDRIASELSQQVGEFKRQAQARVAVGDLLRRTEQLCRHSFGVLTILKRGFDNRQCLMLQLHCRRGCLPRSQGCVGRRVVPSQ